MLLKQFFSLYSQNERRKKKEIIHHSNTEPSFGSSNRSYSSDSYQNSESFYANRDAFFEKLQNDNAMRPESVSFVIN